MVRPGVDMSRHWSWKLMKTKRVMIKDWPDVNKGRQKQEVHLWPAQAGVILAIACQFLFCFPATAHSPSPNAPLTTSLDLKNTLNWFHQKQASDLEKLKSKKVKFSERFEHILARVSLWQQTIEFK